MNAAIDITINNKVPLSKSIGVVDTDSVLALPVK